MTEGAAPDRLGIELYYALDALPAEEHLFSLIAYHGAPTVSGLKPATMLCFGNGRKALLDAWRARGASVCAELGLACTELRGGETGINVLLYRAEALLGALEEPEATALLREQGYDVPASLERYLERLSFRFADACPHEVGVFLGIPAEDVRGFMRHGGMNCHFCSYWKVYHEPEAARERFARFDEARRAVGQAILAGRLCAPWAERASA